MNCSIKVFIERDPTSVESTSCTLGRNLFLGCWLCYWPSVSIYLYVFLFARERERETVINITTLCWVFGWGHFYSYCCNSPVQSIHNKQTENVRVYFANGN